MLNPVETHTALMHDEVRVSAYERAIAATVKSGDVVLDLGAGTGVMGLLACRAGAARVYSIEAGGMVEILRQIVRDNRLEDRVVCLHGDSTRVELPERVDVVIADQAGPFGIGGGLFKAFNDAHRRFFKPQARTIPSRIELSIALAEFPGGTDLIRFWDKQQFGFDMSAMGALAQNTGFEIYCNAAQLLSAPEQIFSFNLGTPSPAAESGAAKLGARRGGTLHGLFAFFTAELAPGVSISNSPLGPNPIQRRAWYLPIGRPCVVEEAAVVGAAVHLLPTEEMVMWQVELAGRDAAEKFVHSTVKSTLVAREDLQRIKPDYIPTLSASGQIDRAILDLCDGVLSVRDIVEEIHLRFPQKFTSRDEVAVAVNRVIARKSL